MGGRENGMMERKREKGLRENGWNEDGRGKKRKGLAEWRKGG